LDLPALTEDEEALLGAMRQRIAAEIEAAGGAIGFDRYMEMALYAPGLGYYVNGRRRFGRDGDFVTAPEISPLFSLCLARQVADCLDRLDGGEVLEVGAGSGRMAADLLAGLAELDALPARYLILEVSPDLRATQAATLAERVPALAGRVEWLDGLPGSGWQGVVLANELLDAMPVHRFRRASGGWQELLVEWSGAGFADRWTAPRSPGLLPALADIWPPEAPPENGYSSELNLRMAPWLQAVSAALGRGYLLLIDYGYTEHEYYHPERTQGTLVCHFRHRVFADPYRLPGLQDMTANVDFSALARAGQAVGLALAGFTTQAHFLIDNGMDELIAASDPSDMRRHLALVQGAKQLLLPGEMGERFKVMALARGVDTGLRGFRSRDLSERL
jgi:SAM-dependent MidA family methyltransferase